MERSEHWLWRLDAGAWLRAAQVELDACAAHITSRRTSVTHARRAAGMALNAVLTSLPDGETRWGRSYLEHLQALTRGATDPLPEEMRAAATTLLAIVPVAPPGLVTLARGPHAAADEALAAARAIVDACTAIVG